MPSHVSLRQRQYVQITHHSRPHYFLKTVLQHVNSNYHSYVGFVLFFFVCFSDRSDRVNRRERERESKRRTRAENMQKVLLSLNVYIWFCLFHIYIRQLVAVVIYIDTALP